MIVTIGSGPKVFSSGFNLKFWMAKPDTNISLSLTLYHDLLRRILTLGFPTVCVINGHAIAGGVFLALAHDHTIMISNPKFNMFLNELESGFVVPFGLIRFIREMTTTQVYKKLCLGDKIKST